MRIRQRRLEVGMSQEKRGDALELTFQQVQKYEKGSNRVSASRLVELANVLGVDVRYFFEDARGSGVPGRYDDQPNLTRILSDRTGARLCAAFLKIDSAEIRTAIANMVEHVASPT